MARRHLCDGCDGPRRRWQRLCDICWPILPGDLRTGLVAAWHAGDKPRWRTMRKQVRAFVAGLAHNRARAAVKAATFPPERAYALAARITGDRE